MTLSVHDKTHDALLGALPWESFAGLDDPARDVITQEFLRRASQYGLKIISTKPKRF